MRGMRITVYDVLSYLASGMTYEEVLRGCFKSSLVGSKTF
ncbi:DUF433 domain-containing protein [Nostoc sp. UHCC 0702]|nr:DUF433 domain-containing protein [Nostoc sp. UHCC 0702]